MELKPCPFCGGKDIKIDLKQDNGGWGGPPWYEVSCAGCYATIKSFEKNDAAKAWNRRAE